MAEQPAMKKLEAHCARCSGIRSCIVEAEVKKSKEIEDTVYYEDWQILKCEGCKYTFLLKSSYNNWTSRPVTDWQGEVEWTFDKEQKYWPPISKRKRPEWLIKRKLDTEDNHRLYEALTETYTAIDSDLHMLAGIGIRTSFEITSTLIGIEARNFGQILNELITKDLIKAADKDRLGALVNAGNASAHRGWTPDHKDLNILCEILEHFIHDAILGPMRRAELDEHARAINARVPPKPKGA
ncbi:DUF4145 domain-containing protein [Methylobacterium sp. WCS2018Hpa-22]|uniref:DUF4145 domain-containing protein n=1 Tax=Methylobacterium sp. WCS2018Hpa-22 TaxID=3073633 RepID=UPI00288BA11B|nr:DUF4145 domain-containing protein [Methylobacterium sp. WCS2018Hpa-22]